MEFGLKNPYYTENKSSFTTSNGVWTREIQHASTELYSLSLQYLIELK